MQIDLLSLVHVVHSRAVHTVEYNGVHEYINSQKILNTLKAVIAERCLYISHSIFNMQTELNMFAYYNVYFDI